MALCTTQRQKDNRKRAADQINNIAVSKAASIKSYSDASVRVPLKKKSRTIIPLSLNRQGKKIPRHHGAQHCLLMYKMSGMPNIKWKFHSSKNSFGKRSNQASIRDGLGGSLGNRSYAVNNYQKYENN